MMLKWVVEIRIDETWVRDGFELTAEGMHDYMMTALPFAYEREITTKILKAPKPDVITHIQETDPDES